VIVNGESTEMDHLADAVVQGRIGDVVPTILSARDDQSRLNR
jgi:NAD-dependent SIR2 family protein deacetylase